MQLKSPRVQSNTFPVKNQIVHIKDKSPRGAWKIAKIQELIISRDGEIRSAKVLLPSGITVNRPLNLLYPLETAIPEYNVDETPADDSCESNITQEVDHTNTTEGADSKQDVNEYELSSRRKAGIIAREKLNRLLRNEATE